MTQHDPSDFFAFLFSECEGKINVRPIPGGNEFYSPQAFLPRICLKKHDGKNLYFGVATRDGRGGGKQNIVHIPALWTDVDEKETPRDILRQKWAEVPLKPSAVVASGGGWHLYWKLKEPLGQSEIPTVESCLRRLAGYFGGDTNATDASRVLRFPGSRNHKYDPPREVRIKRLDPTLQYNLDDFDFLPEDQVQRQQAKTTDAVRSPGQVVKSLTGVGEGNRNATCAMLAGRYLAKKFSVEEVVALLLAWNLKNKPPLPEDEVRRVVESVSNTDARNHPLVLPHITEVLRKVEADIKAGRKQKIGFDPCFDFLRKTIRAIIPTHLYIVGGYTSIGKTAFVIDLIMRLLKQNPAVAIFTVEMSASQYALRMLANQTGIPPLRLMLDEVSDEQNEAIYEAFHVLNRANLHIFDDIYEFKKIAEISEVLKQKFGLDILVIDFIQNLIGQGGIYDRMSRLAPQLQTLAKELDLTLIALSQVSNEAVKESLEVIGFKGAGEIAAAADLAIWLERKNKEDRTDPNIVAWIRKNRHGPVGRRILQYEASYTRFREMDDTESNYFQKKYGRDHGER